jgi:hypothetical protein
MPPPKSSVIFLRVLTLNFQRRRRRFSSAATASLFDWETVLVPRREAEKRGNPKPVGKNSGQQNKAENFAILSLTLRSNSSLLETQNFKEKKFMESNRSRVSLTVKELVAAAPGPSELTAKAIDVALRKARNSGYLPNYTPLPSDADQRMILLSSNHRFAALYRAMAIDGSATPVWRELVEITTQVPLENAATALLLSYYGLAMVRLAGSTVILRGVPPVLASLANRSRYRPGIQMATWELVETLLGITLPPFDIGLEIRMQAAEILMAVAVVAEGLLDDEHTIAIVPHWDFTLVSEASE